MPAAPTPRGLKMLSAVQAGDEVSAYQSSLRECVVSSVTPEHVRAVVEGIIQRAINGDANALTHFFQYLCGGMNNGCSQSISFHAANAEDLQIAARIGRAKKVKAETGGGEFTDDDIDDD